MPGSFTGIRRGVIAIIILLGALFSGCGDDDTATDTVRTATEDETVNFLFTQDAGGGALTGEPDGSYTLTLTGVDDETVVFPDRPLRDARVMDTAAFAAGFAGLFGDDLPNAALTFEPPGNPGTVDTAIFSISEADYDGEAGTLTYKAVNLPLDDAEEAVSRSGRPLEEMPAAFGPASLFIDAVPTIVNPRITDMIEGTSTTDGDSWNLTIEATDADGPATSVEVRATMYVEGADPDRQSFTKTIGPDGRATFTGNGVPRDLELELRDAESTRRFACRYDWAEATPGKFLLLQFQMNEACPAECSC